MPFTITNQGSGDPRDVIISYHGSVDPSLDPTAAIAADIQPGFKQLYDRTDVGGILPLSEALQRIQDAAGPFTVSRLILVGFSEGVQGVRAQLREGAMPDAVVVVDGTHSATGFPDQYISPWKNYVESARNGQGLFIASHSQIKTTGYENTHDTLQKITGFTLDTSGPVPDCARHQDGNIIVYSCDGDAAQDHINQAKFMLPKMVSEAVSGAGASGGFVSSNSGGTNWFPLVLGGIALGTVGYLVWKNK